MNKKILISLSVIAVAAVVAVGATVAYFSSTASVANNTFSTGVLELKVRGNGQTGGEIDGPDLSNVAPGDCLSGQFAVLNYNAANFGGNSTLPAKELRIKAQKTSGDSILYNALIITVEANRGWSTWMSVYNGNLNALSEANLLSPRWTELASGHSEDVRYMVCLPNSGNQNSLQGKTATFKFVVDGYNPAR